MNTNDHSERASLYSFCLQSNCTSLLKEWHPVKNGDIRPWTLSYGSQKKIWWQCGRGHEWQAIVKSRVRGSGCPICAGRVVVKGFNDLATLYPDIAAEWHPTKNDKADPAGVGVGTDKQYWWICEQGHEWHAAVSSRTRGSGCPVCAGKEVQPGFNDLASEFPAIAGEWVADKNLPLTPESVTPFSNKRVWWRCALGHEWQAAVSSRTSQFCGCPFCTGRMVLAGFNDLETVFPKIASEWHPTRNGRLTPQMVTSGSSKRVWWQCPLGHEWRAIISSRTGPRKHGCPECNGRYAALPFYSG